MDNKIVINEEQFRKLVIREAKKILSEEIIQKEDKKEAPASKRKVTFEKVESLIKEIEGMSKSISSIKIEDGDVKLVISEKKTVKRDVDMDEYNKKKNVIHVNENEKDKWNRMLNYKIPSDNER
ncbi:MAG: hypothetical protein AABY15_07270 [Nanoarchaeota archaeon]